MYRIGLSLLIPPLLVRAERPYVLTQSYTPQNFFEGFDFFTDPDPTGGFVQYVSGNTAESQGLVRIADDGGLYVGVDHTNIYSPSGPGRPSVRLQGREPFTEGLIVLDLSHMPVGCGTWPAFWSTGNEWPLDGEIDIIESINDATKNGVALHTSGNCSVRPTITRRATWKSTDCNANNNDNEGCAAELDQPNSYGADFNQNQGGVYAVSWTPSAIDMWVFPRNAVPTSLSSPASFDPATPGPDVTQFGKPAVTFMGTCSFTEFFFNHTLVFNTDFCGSWAGQNFGVTPGSTCPTIPGASPEDSCRQYVANNPQAFNETYWDIRSLRVWSQITSYETAFNAPINRTSEALEEDLYVAALASTTASSSTDLSAATSLAANLALSSAPVDGSAATTLAEDTSPLTGGALFAPAAALEDPNLNTFISIRTRQSTARPTHESFWDSLDNTGKDQVLQLAHAVGAQLPTTIAVPSDASAAAFAANLIPTLPANINAGVAQGNVPNIAQLPGVAIPAVPVPAFAEALVPTIAPNALPGLAANPLAAVNPLANVPLNIAPNAVPNVAVSPAGLREPAAVAVAPLSSQATDVAVGGLLGLLGDDTKNQLLQAISSSQNTPGTLREDAGADSMRLHQFVSSSSTSRATPSPSSVLKSWQNNVNSTVLETVFASLPMTLKNSLLDFSAKARQLLTPSKILDLSKQGGQLNQLRDSVNAVYDAYSNLDESMKQKLMTLLGPRDPRKDDTVHQIGLLRREAQNGPAGLVQPVSPNGLNQYSAVSPNYYAAAQGLPAADLVPTAIPSILLPPNFVPPALQALPTVPPPLTAIVPGLQALSVPAGPSASGLASVHDTAQAASPLFGLLDPDSKAELIAIADALAVGNPSAIPAAPKSSAAATVVSPPPVFNPGVNPVLPVSVPNTGPVAVENAVPNLSPVVPSGPLQQASGPLAAAAAANAPTNSIVGSLNPQAKNALLSLANGTLSGVPVKRQLMVIPGKGISGIQQASDVAAHNQPSTSATLDAILASVPEKTRLAFLRFLTTALSVGSEAVDSHSASPSLDNDIQFAKLVGSLPTTAKKDFAQWLQAQNTAKLTPVVGSWNNSISPPAVGPAAKNTTPNAGHLRARLFKRVPQNGPATSPSTVSSGLRGPFNATTTFGNGTNVPEPEPFLTDVPNPNADGHLDTHIGTPADAALADGSEDTPVLPDVDIPAQSWPTNTTTVDGTNITVAEPSVTDVPNPDADLADGSDDTPFLPDLDVPVQSWNATTTTVDGANITVIQAVGAAPAPDSNVDTDIPDIPLNPLQIGSLADATLGDDNVDGTELTPDFPNPDPFDDADSDITSEPFPDVDNSAAFPSAPIFSAIPTEVAGPAATASHKPSITSSGPLSSKLSGSSSVPTATHSSVPAPSPSGPSKSIAATIQSAFQAVKNIFGKFLNAIKAGSHGNRDGSDADTLEDYAQAKREMQAQRKARAFSG